MRHSCLVLLMFLACLPAQAADCAKASIWVSALDKSGTVEKSLKAEDLRVEVGGEPAQILSFVSDEQPRRVLVMVDTSARMRTSPWESSLRVVLTVAEFAANTLPSESSALLLTFGDDVIPESDEFETRQQVGQRILDLSEKKPRGRTLLFDAIDKALATFGDAQFGDSIYLVTDGGDDGSKISYSKIREKLAQRGVRVFVFLAVVAPYSQAATDLMGDLERYTGGAFVDIPQGWKDDQARRTRLAAQVSDQVGELYKIQLQTPDPGHKSTKIKAALANQTLKEDGHTVTFTRELPPCQSNP
jgi:hypothetical protein